MSLIYLSLVLFLSIDASNQELWTQAELERANTAKDVAGLTEEEKKVVMLVNLARLDGSRYLRSYFQEHNQTSYDEMLRSKNKYLVSLRKDLDAVKGLPMLKPDPGLMKAARYHAKDSGKNGLVGHASSNGTDFGKRLPKYVKGWNRIAENCSYGFNDAANIVGQLLLDDNVPSLGHRKSIINPALEYIGVAIEPHSQYRYNCVMDFCAKFKD
jgi:uncharacterized protein YkwD